MKSIYMFVALLFCSALTAEETIQKPVTDSLAQSPLIGTWSGEADFRGMPANICMVIAPGPGSKQLVLEYKVTAGESAKPLFSGLGIYALMPENRVEGSWLDSMNSRFQLKGDYTSAVADAATRMSVTLHRNDTPVGRSEYSTNSQSNTLEITDSILDKNNAYKPFFKASLSRTQSAECAR